MNAQEELSDSNKAEWEKREDVNLDSLLEHMRVEKFLGNRQERDEGKCLISETEPGMWIDYLRNLFQRVNGAVQTSDARIVGPTCVEELDGDFTIQEVREGVKNTRNGRNTRESVKGIQYQKSGLETLRKLFHAKRKRKNFPKSGRPLSSVLSA
jgi:hypothetical protein